MRETNWPCYGGLNIDTDGFDRPWLDGTDTTFSVSDTEEGHTRTGSDDVGRIVASDVLFHSGETIAAVTKFIQNPSTSYPGSHAHVSDTCSIRHAYDEKTDQLPQHIDSSPARTGQENECEPVTVEVGTYSVRTNRHGTGQSADLEYDENEKRARWHLNHTGSESSTKKFTVASIATYDSEIEAGDDVLRRVLEGTFARLILGVTFDHETVRDDVVYEYFG